LPEDRVTLSGQPQDPSRQQIAEAPFGPPKRASREAIAQTPPLFIHTADEEADPETAPLGEKATDRQEAEEIRDLKQRDAEVKAHEQAHMAAGGGLVQGAASYTYEKGPDGAMYAVGGEVKIDTSPARTPEQTVRKAQQIRRAALAPAQPSATDRAVAAAASQMEAQARAQKTQESVSGEEANASESAAPEAASPEAASPEAASGAKIDPSEEEAPKDTPSYPFATPAIQAYRAADGAFHNAQAISTFV
jgi:hypothetical protein